MTRYKQTMGEVLAQIRADSTAHINEEKFAGWIAFFKGKKLEIRKDQAKDLWGAKQIAMKTLKVPNSQKGLLAIEPAYEEFVKENDEPASPDEMEMAHNQLEFIEYAVNEVEEYMKSGVAFPEWLQNKLTKAHEVMKDIHAYMEGERSKEAEYGEQKESVELTEASASADARRAMRHDPDMTQRFSQDVKATDADKAASAKNMIVQLRKSSDVKGNYPIEFADGKKQKVDAKVIDTLLKAHDKIQKPSDKEKFVAMISKSYRDMLNVTKMVATQLKMGEEVSFSEETLDEFNKKDYRKNEDDNEHTLNALELVKKFGTPQEIKDMQGIYDRHMKRGHITEPDYSKRNAYDKKYYPKLKESVELEEKFVVVYKHKATGAKLKSTVSTYASAKMSADMLKAQGHTVLDIIEEETNLEEKLKVSDGLGAWIDDFVKSDAPQFQGKDKEERKNMAIAAFTDAGGKLESVEESSSSKFLNKQISNMQTRNNFATGKSRIPTPAERRAEMEKQKKKEETELDEGKVKEFLMTVDDIVSKMKKDRVMKPFADKFKQDVMKTYDVRKSLDKVLPDYVSGGSITKLVSEEVDAKKVVDYLVKKGNNPKDAQKMVDKQLAYVNKTYKGVTVAKAAEIISSLKEEEEPKNDQAKSVEQERDDKKKTRIAQLQLQIAKAQEMINRLNRQTELDKMNKGENYA